MPANGIFEAIVHLDSFRNIDLFFKGFYYIECKAYFTMPGNNRLYACPQVIHQSDDVSHYYEHNILNPQMLDSDNLYRSKVFLIKYCQEIVNLSEIVVFRAEFEMTRPNRDIPLIVETKLFFSEPSNAIPDEELLDTMRDPSRFTQFKQVGLNKLKINRPIFGINQMMPVSFSEFYSSVLKVSIHTMLVDFKFNNGYDSIFPKNDTSLSSEKLDRLYEEHVLHLTIIHNKIRNYVLKAINDTEIENLSDCVTEEISLPIWVDNINEDDLFLVPEEGVSRCLFSKYVKTRNKYELFRFILNELREVVSSLCVIKHAFIEVMRVRSTYIIGKFEIQHNEAIKNFWSQFICIEKKLFPCELFSDSDINLVHSEMTIAMRKAVFYKGDPDIIDTSCMENVPIIFEEVYENLESSSENKYSQSESHLFVLVHGLSGSFIDMKKIRDTIGLAFPNAEFLMSRANEKNTMGSIKDMGFLLAQEVISYVHLQNSFKIKRISFIGHSLGGIIIRAALEHLEIYKEKMNIFISLCSPHLGSIYGDSKLVGAGCWLLRMSKKNVSIQQLALKDTEDPRNSFIYRLAFDPCIGWFKKIFLVSSLQDGYVPFQSARIEAGKGVFKDDTLQLEMASAIMSNINAEAVYRIDSIFDIPEISLGNLIGRAAHVQAIDCAALFKMLISIHYSVFA
ncbi:unnamed protein product [Blepharisma stoltei]|uniref:DUF676 domain-containing protein n=1 Tax=Blepharisma stoltei TaxID=1481888 RepID=A0AAU9J790_9CILI|nr:unnamed protein product [Blepharisma stoltei]